MILRIVAALSFVVALTAFAPAPFPKQPRKVKIEVDDHILIQGSWKITAYERPGLKGIGVIRTTYTHVKIEQNQWTLMRDLNGRMLNSVTYDLKLDPKTLPRKMDMTRDLGATKYFQAAIYKFEGDRLKVMTGGLYGVAGGLGAKPKMPELSFENPPSNTILYTLERER